MDRSPPADQPPPSEQLSSTDDRIEWVLDAEFSDRDVADVNGTGPSWNERNHTVRLDFADGETAYLKVANDGDGSRIARERAAIAYVAANSGVPVPTVVASAPDAAVPYLVTAPMSGECIVGPWSERDVTERAAMARQVGRALASVHALPVEDRERAVGSGPDHGQIVGGDADGLDVEMGPWTDVLVDRIEYTRDLSPAERFGRHFDEVVDAVAANRDLLDDAPAALVHGDPAKPNCFRCEGRDADSVGFVDWEIAHVGDPARELVRVRDQQIDGLRSGGSDEVVDALHEGYRERAGGLPAGFEARRPIYEAVRFLGVSGFFEKYAEFLDESPEEFAEWVRAEMDRRLAAIR